MLVLICSKFREDSGGFGRIREGLGLSHFIIVLIRVMSYLSNDIPCYAGCVVNSFCYEKILFFCDFCLAMTLSSSNAFAGYEIINCMVYSNGWFIPTSECDNPGTNCNTVSCNCSNNGAWTVPDK